MHPAIYLTESAYYGPPPERVGAEQVDAFALMAWLHKDELIARLEGEIDELADDSQAVDPAERAQREAAIISAMFNAELAEERFIEMAEAAGTPIVRRDDMDVRAFLGLDASAPA